MSIKSQIGEIVEALVKEESTGVDIYHVEIETSDSYKCFDAKAEIDNYGDLMVKVKIEEEDIRELFSDDKILNFFTEEELKEYLGIEDD